MSDLSQAKAISLKRKVSPQEWAMRIDVAACYRLVALCGMNDLVLPGAAMILRNHGLLTAGCTVCEAFVTMHWLEKACQAQVMAMACAAENTRTQRPKLQGLREKC